LYAAIPPHTPTTIVLSFNTPIVGSILRRRREEEKEPRGRRASHMFYECIPK
jgi:hypothetical protein